MPNFASDPVPRDPARIEPTLAAVRSYWKNHSDLRLGQIIGNCSNVVGVDAYRVEDEDLVRILTSPDGPQRSEGDLG